ncbi:type II toxin-antitoxin system RelE/ParE family toxin [Cylindrospermum stagnale]|uniref:type II toxin-antitoxin system RelE/ParE family toxin n=1 Tax=Cylindrospermum stagnale TaxID=142864 RepID=UPI00316ADA68
MDARERFTREFNKKCQNLAKFPNIGRSYANVEPSLRGIPLDGYIIFYQLFENSIVIVRVVSGYRDLENQIVIKFISNLSRTSNKSFSFPLSS